METHLKPSKLGKAASIAFGGCDWVSNSIHSTNSCMILVGWDKTNVNLMVVHMTSQVMLTEIEILKSKQKMFCSFVYASNSRIERRNLWNELRRMKKHSAGGSRMSADMQDFAECVNDIKVEDVNYSGHQFTWTSVAESASALSAYVTCRAGVGQLSNSQHSRTHKSGCSAVSQNNTSQGTIGADGQVFIFDNDAVRLDFTKFVIQQALPFNHFDNVKLTEIIKRRLQPRFKFGILGLLHQVITTIADRIRGGSLLALKCLVWFMKYYANVRRTVADFSHAPLNEYSPSPDDKKQWSLGCWFGGKLIQKLRQKGVYEESFSRHAAWIGGKLIQFMHTTMVPVQVKTMKIQAGVQVSRQGELRRHLQLWKCFGRLYFCCICT
ncbi:hypothetical protein Tco_0837172 [Tanacetum coccineum]